MILSLAAHRQTRSAAHHLEPAGRVAVNLDTLDHVRIYGDERPLERGPWVVMDAMTARIILEQGDRLAAIERQLFNQRRGWFWLIVANAGTLLALLIWRMSA